MSEARDASTVILVRPVEGGTYEVLMTKRPESMRFMGGTYVFPGGALDDGECAPEMEPVSALAPNQARARISEDIEGSVALGLHCCAVRELFEEVGVLLARDAKGNDVDPRMVIDEYVPRRDEFAHDPSAFAAFLRTEGLVMSTDRLVWHGRLITPESSPIRFDARFFVAPMPAGQHVVPDEVEVDAVMWISPAEAIRGAGEKRLSVPVPTMSILQGLSEVPGYEQLMRGARVVREVRTGAHSALVSYVLAPNPGLATGPGTNTYIVGKGDVVVIDPAVPDAIYVERVVRDAWNRGRVTLILLTHMHPDHTGGAAVLAEQFGCDVAAWKGVSDVPFVTRHLDDGEAIEAGGATLRALYTPGHASHHLCYLLEQEGSVFAGDLVAGAGTVVIAPPDGNMGDYLKSLERLKATGVKRIFPGHGPAVDDGQGKLAEYIAHRRDRERQVIDALKAGNTDIPGMVKHIYTDVSPALHAMAQGSVRAHLEMLEVEGRVRRDGESWSLVG